MHRPLLFFGVLLAAVGVPYLLLDEKIAANARGTWNSLLGNSDKESDEPRAEFTTAGAHSTPSPTIEQVFRFDLSPQWVTSRWRWVSTVAGDPRQLGMRVPLVSGTRHDDIAGSLTYYFDEHHRLQRITFTGQTADPRRLLAAVIMPFGLKSQPTTDAAHYVAGDPKQPTSEVIVQHAPLTDVNGEPAKAEVSVDLSRDDAMHWREKAQREPEVKLLPSGYRRW
jgi:hypothetical protein